MFQIVCSWCGRLMGVKPSEGTAADSGTAISHGICPGCEAQLRREAQALLRKKNQARTNTNP